MYFEYKIFPISDSSLTIEFGNSIDEKLNQFILDFAKCIDSQSIKGVLECVPAYCSLTFFYQPNRNFNYQNVKNQLEKLLNQFDWKSITVPKENIIEIPIIYDGEDIQLVANYCKVSIAELIEIHSSKIYRVFMMGFLPGFAYLGGMNERIAIPRKETPRLKVPSGSIGIAGKQTGIYPLESPGGWQLIGRTELKLFDKNRMNPTFFKAGDLVKFIPI